MQCITNIHNINNFIYDNIDVDIFEAMSIKDKDNTVDILIGYMLKSYNIDYVIYDTRYSKSIISRFSIYNKYAFFSIFLEKYKEKRDSLYYKELLEFIRDLNDYDNYY